LHAKVQAYTCKAPVSMDLESYIQVSKDVLLGAGDIVLSKGYHVFSTTDGQLMFLMDGGLVRAPFTVHNAKGRRINKKIDIYKISGMVISSMTDEGLEKIASKLGLPLHENVSQE